MQLQEMSLNEYLQSRLIASGFRDEEVIRALDKLNRITETDEDVKGYVAAQLWGVLDKTAPITLCEKLVDIANRAAADGQYSAAIQAIELLHREFPAKKWLHIVRCDF